MRGLQPRGMLPSTRLCSSQAGPFTVPMTACHPGPVPASPPSPLFSSCCASSRKPSRPDQRGLPKPSPVGARRHIQGRRLDHLLPGTLWALLCSEQALCTPVRGEPGPSQSSGPWC